jgi:hypothetical protein
MIHFGPEGEVVGIEVLHRESGDKGISEEYGYPLTHADPLAWAARYHAMKVQEKAEFASKEACREAQDLI